MGEREARALAQHLLATSLPRRWRHVQAVAARAAHMCSDLPIDSAIVVSAAWLHDIGYAPGVAATGFHPLDGARYLRQHGWDDSICALVAHHTNAAKQATAHGLRESLDLEFANTGGVSRDILWAADSTTGPNGEPLMLDERLREVAARYGPNHQITQAMTASRPALAEAIARVDASLASAGAHV